MVGREDRLDIREQYCSMTVSWIWAASRGSATPAGPFAQARDSVLNGAEVLIEGGDASKLPIEIVTDPLIEGGGRNHLLAGLFASRHGVCPHRL